MVDKVVAKAVELEIQPIHREEGKSDTSKPGSRPVPSSLRPKAPFLQLRLVPPSPPATPELQLSSYFEPYNYSVHANNLQTPPATPYNSHSPPAPLHVHFSLPPDHIIGYGRYRQWRFKSKEEVLAHIDAQIVDISSLLISSNMLDCKIPGYDDVTFGERLWAKSECEMDEARTALKPSTETSSDGTMIHHGFPGAECIIKRADSRRCLTTLLADELDHQSKHKGSYKCRSFDPMGCPDKGNTEAWGKVGFTLHPLLGRKRLVRRKWSELEKLPPKWGPVVAKREEAERYRQEQRVAAYIRKNGDTAGCFRVEGGPSEGGYRVNIGGNNILAGERNDISKISGTKDEEIDNEDWAKALEDFENAIASDSDSNDESVYNTTNENAIESDSDCGCEICSNGESQPRLQKPIAILRKGLGNSTSQPVTFLHRPTRPEVETTTAPNVNVNATSSHHSAKIRANLHKPIAVPRPILKKSTLRPVLPPCRPKSPEVDAAAALNGDKSQTSPNIGVDTTSPRHDPKNKGKGKATDYQVEATVLAKRRVVRFAL